MNHKFKLVAIDVTTGGELDHNQVGAEPRQVRLLFAEAAFESPEDHWHALHDVAAHHAQMTEHMSGLTLLDFKQSEHDGRPAYTMTVARFG
jgi:hypothetical protein